MNGSGRKRTKNSAVQRLSILLALLLFFGPLLSIAAPLTAAYPPAEDAAQSFQPLCHSMAAAEQIPLESVPVDTKCPHCSGDGPASQCHCWGYSLPAGLASKSICGPAMAAPGVLLRIAADAVPDSPPENRFRPPILIHI